MMQKEKNEASSKLFSSLEKPYKLINQTKKAKEAKDRPEKTPIKVYINNNLFEIEIPQSQVTCGWLLEQVIHFHT